MTRLRATAILTALSGAVLLAKGLWIPAKAELAYGLMDRASEKAQLTRSPTKPWSWADFSVLGELRIAGEDIHVLDRATDQALAFGAGRHEEYALDGPLVLSGHRDTHFAVLKHARVGDHFSFETTTGSDRYRISETRIYDLREGVLLPPEKGQMMLITCWPFDAIDPNTPKRFLVLAEKAGASARPALPSSQ